MNEKQVIAYPVMEHFYTLQGEGQYTGCASYFVRLGGCDVGCTWCDVKESWDMETHPLIDVEKITELIKNSGTKIAVITGGEPTLHPLEVLTSAVKTMGVRTHIETSGTNPLTGVWDWVCFSPKRFKKHLEEYYTHSDELKIIIAHKNDFRWALELASKMNSQCKLYIQPEWENRAALEPLCIEFIKQHPNWTLSIQTHKYLGIE